MSELVNELIELLLIKVKRAERDVKEAQALIDKLREDRPRATQTGTPSKQERRILSMIQKGLTTPKIASILNLSTRTVEAHKYNLSKKLGLHSARELKNIVDPKI